MRCLSLPPSLMSKKRFIAPLLFLGPPEPKDLGRVLLELLLELRDLAMDGVDVTLPSGEKKRVRAVLVEWVTDSRGGEKLEQCGGAGKKVPCALCAAIALLRAPGNTHPYIGGYVSTVPRFTAAGVIDCNIGDERLHHTHEEIMAQGALIEQLEREAVSSDTRIPAARLKELKQATGSNRQSQVLVNLPWLSGTVLSVIRFMSHINVLLLMRIQQTFVLDVDLFWQL